MNEAISRRRVLQGAYGMMGAASLGGWVFASPMEAMQAPQNAIAPADALKRLMDGNGRYAANQPTSKDFSAGRAARATAQHPVVAVLGCADSRVAPELVFDQTPGDVFSVRVAGNYSNADNLASLEYAVAVLNAPLVMVLGHTNCGAVSAVVKDLQDSAALPGHINIIVDAIKPGVQKVIAAGGDHMLDSAIEANVRYTVERLKSAQPILAERYKGKKIDIVGGVYQLATGKVKLL